MEKLKQYIDKRKDVLYKSMDNDEYVSPNMLDNALSVINTQNKYIDELEKKIDKLLNYIEDMQIHKTLEERDKKDNGIRYTVEDLILGK